MSFGSTLKLVLTSTFFFSLLICLVAIIAHRWTVEVVPDVGKSIQEIIESRGFKHETHFIESQNGYRLQTVRIINPLAKKKKLLKPIILWHGFQCAGSVWLVAADGKLRKDGTYVEQHENQEIVTDAYTKNTVAPVGNSLGFVLAASGYDVWLANYRGNIYSSNHSTLDPNEEAFWHFSVDEMIRYDLPTVIDYVRDVTGRKTVGYIGHSQGNFMMFGLLSTQPQYSQVIKPYIALSPVVYFKHFEAPIRLFRPIRRQLLSLFPRTMFRNVHRILAIPSMCSSALFHRNLCLLIYKLLAGSPTNQIDFNRISVYLDNIGFGSSTRNFVHLLQAKDESGEPRFYDFDNVTKNIEVYGQLQPPLYDISQVNSTDIALFYTKRDWYNHLKDVDALKQKLKVKLMTDFVVPDPNWNHMELLWAKDVGTVVNSRILRILKQY